MNYKSQIEEKLLPKHVAIIMDGNGRWTKEKGKNKLFGHSNGVKTVKKITEVGAKIGIKYLTLYAFSTENWRRPIFEITGLMNLLFHTLGQELKTIKKNNIRLSTIGDLTKLPKKTKNKLLEGVEDTKDNEGMNLILALNYSGRQEIISAIKKISEDVKNDKIDLSNFDAKQLNPYLYTKDIPDPELLIRTSGEYRVSNFLLWQAAYSEFYFTKEYWPEFNEESFYKALVWYQSRERRFGKISEQLNKY